MGNHLSLARKPAHAFRSVYACSDTKTIVSGWLSEGTPAKLSFRGAVKFFKKLAHLGHVVKSSH
jgi:hypothetical protein